MSAPTRRCSLSALLLAALCVPALPSPAAAAEAPWIPLGPSGGPVWSLAVDPSAPRVVYAGTPASGLFKSVTRGRRWMLLAQSPSGFDFPFGDDLLIHPLDGQRVYALTNFEEAWASADAGATWRLLPDPFLAATRTLRDLALDPALPGHLYAATTGGPYESFDDGASWQPLGDFPVNPATGAPLALFQLAVDPLHPAVLYVVAGVNGVFKSTDRGTTWSPASIGLPSFTNVKELTIARGDPSRLLLATFLEGFYESRDGAVSWQRLEPGLGGVITDLAIDPFDPDLAYAASFQDGLYRSRDGGRRWQRVDAGISGVPTAVTLDPSTPGVVYAGSETGAWRSVDGGETWQFRSAGLAGQDIRTVAATVSGRLLAGTEDGVVLTSFDGGANWARTHPPPNRPVPDVAVSGLAYSPVDPDRAWAAARDVLVSDDGGVTWRVARPGSSQKIPTRLFVDPVDPDTAYVASFLLLSFSEDPTQLFKTTDGGATWVDIVPEVFFEPLSLAIDAGDTDTLFLGGHGGLVRSRDGGASWTDLTERAGVAGSPVTSVALDPDRPTRLWIATLDGRFLRSDDGGETWRLLGAGLPPGWVDRLLVAGEPSVLYAVSRGAGVVRSRDGGLTFEPVGRGLAAGVDDLAASPTDPPVLFAATDRGVYRLREAACLESATVLCLGEGRFRVEVDWQDRGRSGAGRVRRLTSRAGAFWFFRPDNLELTVRMLDGRPVNGNWWLFFGGLSSLPYTLTVSDTATGRVFRYHNPRGTLASRGVTTAFPDGASDGVVALGPTPEDALALMAGDEPEAAAAPVPRAATPLTLLERFDLSVQWDTGRGHTGAGHGVATGANAGYVWYFDARNPELTLKILDGRAVNGHFWLFYSALSNVGFELTVTDRQSGTSRTYRHPPGSFVARADVEAF